MLTSVAVTDALQAAKLLPELVLLWQVADQPDNVIKHTLLHQSSIKNDATCECVLLEHDTLILWLTRVSSADLIYEVRENKANLSTRSLFSRALIFAVGCEVVW